MRLAPLALPQHSKTVTVGSTSGEETTAYVGLVPFTRLQGAVRIESERGYAHERALDRMVGTYRFFTQELGHPLLPERAYAYSAALEIVPSSTIVEPEPDLWTSTNTFIAHRPLLIAGAEFAPSFAAQLESVTATTPETIEVRREYLRARSSIALSEGKAESFEFGMDSQLSQRLSRLVLVYGTETVQALIGVLAEGPISISVLGEVFRTLGRIHSETTRDARRALLLHYLNTGDLRVRHVAATGLASLDDPAAIPALEKMLMSEGSEKFRMHLRQVLTQLRATSGTARSRQSKV